MDEKKLLNVTELAHMLGRSTETIKKDMLRNPAAVPPRVRLPHTRLLRWRVADVDAWLASHVVASNLSEGGTR